MSQESLTWLNENVLTGFGVRPWHYREGVSTAPFEGAIPEERVAALFPELLTEDVATLRDGQWNIDADAIAVVAKRDGKRTRLQYASANYVPHPYAETLLGMELPISTAGVLRGGGQVWVQYGFEGVEIEGVRADLKLLGTTSGDGSLATDFAETATLAVCDNTLRIAISRAAKHTRVRHTKNSWARVQDVRAQYSQLADIAELFIEDTAAQIHTTVTDSQIEAFLNEILPASKPGEEDGKARTQQLNKRDHIYDWLGGSFGAYRNTEFGVLQSLDAARRWDFGVRGVSQAEGVWKATIDGKFDTQAAKDKRVLDKVLANV